MDISMFLPTYLIDLIAIASGAIAILYTMRIDKRTEKISSYSDIDSLFKDILQIGIDKPHLRDPDAISNDFENDECKKGEYSSYAYMSMNVIETIFDRTSKYPKLQETWYPVIVDEVKLHHKWFENNTFKFKEPFIVFVKEKIDDFCKST